MEAVIAEQPGSVGIFAAVAYHRPAFAHAHRFSGVKTQTAQSAEGSKLSPFVFHKRSVGAILDQIDTGIFGYSQQVIHPGREPGEVGDDDRFGSVSDGRSHGFGVKTRLTKTDDVGESRRGPGHNHRRGSGNE